MNCNIDILFTNKTATVGADSFAGSNVYCHGDSDWASSTGGNKIYFITSLAAETTTIMQNQPGMVSYTSDHPESNSFIPQSTWSISGNDSATIGGEQTGKGTVYKD